MRKLIAAALFAFASATALAAGPGGPPIYNQSVAQDPSVFNVGTGTVRGPLTVQGLNVGGSLSALNTATATFTTRLNDLDTSTNTLTSSVNAVGLATGTLRTDLNAVGLATGTLRTTLNTVATDTTTLRTAINAVGVDTGTLRGILSTVATDTTTLYANTIHLQSTLQSGATLYASSGTIQNLNITTIQGVTPSLVAGTNVSISGTWPNQTVNSTASGGGGISGQVNTASQYSAGYYSVAGDSNVISGLAPGTSSYVLTSAGSSAAPFWSETPLKESSATATYLQNSSASITYLNVAQGLTQASAASTYLTQSSATATYLQNSSATATYLQTLNASAQYITLSSASATYLNKNNGSQLANITGANIVTMIPTGVLPSTIAYTVSTNTFTAGQTFTYLVKFSSSIHDSNDTPGTSGQALVSNGPGASPTWQTVSGSGAGDNLGTHIATKTVTANYGISATTITGTVALFTGPTPSTVTYGLAVGSLTVTGSTAYSISVLEGATSEMFGPEAGRITFSASSSSHAFVSTFNNSIDTYTIVSSSMTPVAGQAAYWVNAGPNAWTLGATAFPTGGGSGGGASGTINAANQFSLPYYSLAGSTTQISGYPNVTLSTTTAITISTGTTFTSSITIRNISNLNLNSGVGILSAQGVQTSTLQITGLTSQSCIGTDGSGNVQAGTCGGGGGSSTLAVANNIVTYTGPNISSPTAILNFDTATMLATLAGSATAFIELKSSSVTLQGNNLSATYLTNSSATATYLQISSATVTYLNVAQGLTQASAATTYLTQSSATATYPQISSLTATYLQLSSATATYLNKNNLVVISTRTIDIPFTAMGAYGDLAGCTTCFASLESTGSITNVGVVAAFDDTSSAVNGECRTGVFSVASNLATAGDVTMTVYGRSKTAAASKNTSWTLKHQPLTNGEAENSGFLISNSGLNAVSGTQGVKDSLSWTMSISSSTWVANDRVKYAICRSSATNNLSGDYYAELMRIQYPTQ